MYIVIDIILAAIVIICLIVGWKRGFIDEALRLLSGIIAFFCAYFITPYAAPYVNEHLFYGRISLCFFKSLYCSLDIFCFFKNLSKVII